MKNLLRYLTLLFLVCPAVAEQFVLIDFVPDSGSFYVDKDSILKVGNFLYVELRFDMKDNLQVKSQRLFNCRERESTLLKLGVNDLPMQPPKETTPAYVPIDSVNTFSKIFDYTCRWNK